MTEAAPPKKANRAGIVIPFGLVGLFLIGWTVWWFMVAGRVEAETDRSAASLRQSGYQVSWSKREVTGWPFRSFVQLKDVRIVAPSGYSITAPELGAEAETYALGKWVVAAPKGLTLVRGDKGVLVVSGEAIRASLSGVGGPDPRFVLELRKPVFVPGAGAQGFPIGTADLIDFYLEPKADSPDHQARFLFRMLNAQAPAGGTLDRLAHGQALSAEWQGVLTRTDAMHGHTWAEGAKNWADAGGAITDSKAHVTAGKAVADAASTRLAVSADGRLTGPVEVDMQQGPAALLALAGADKVDPTAAATLAASTAFEGLLNGGKAHVSVRFAPEGAYLGELRLAPAPKVY
ncbi:MAG: DUF2125 domain-containing protein [Proteobacteria bacterium]|nr:DUF2125 domain-containing protein [Pseudomonadota bacterium]